MLPVLEPCNEALNSTLWLTPSLLFTAPSCLEVEGRWLVEF
jgi:hypothetical protein